MCSVGDDGDITADNATKFMEPKPEAKTLTGSKCLKCKSLDVAVFVQDKHPYCETCFLSGTIHKFRGLIGKHKIIRAGDGVLVCHRLGHASTALVHFLRTGLDAATHKKIRFKPVFLYVERQWKLTVDERRNIMRQVKQETNDAKFSVYFASLREYVKDPTVLEKAISEDYTKMELRSDDATTCCTGGKSKEDRPSFSIQYELLNIYERNLIVAAAKFLDCKMIFTPELGADVAASLLSTMAVGRGAHATYHSGFMDTSNEEVTILRPLRNFTLKELSSYNNLNNLQPVNAACKSQFSESSIQGLMNRFVTNLQTDYPSTISTVVRTSDKLSADKTMEFNNPKCNFCNASVENERAFGVADATDFSHLVSIKNDIKVNREDCHVLENGKETDDTEFCYACRKLKRFLRN